MDAPDFFAHAAYLEGEAVRIYECLSDIIGNSGDGSVGAFYREMAGRARKHFEETLERAGCRDASELPADGYQWPNGAPPESPCCKTADEIVDLNRAMQFALDAERRAAAFYDHVARTAGNPDVAAVAVRFRTEEEEHVAAMERIMGLRSY